MKNLMLLFVLLVDGQAATPLQKVLFILFWHLFNSSFADFIKNSELMIRQSVWSSLIAAKLASKFLNENGLLTLTGANAALDPTPGKIIFGLVDF